MARDKEEDKDKEKGARAKKPKEGKKSKRENAKDKKPISAYFNKKTFMGVAAVGAVLLLILYVFVYSDFTERTEELEAENKTLSAEVSELEEYNANLEQYRLEIEEIRDAVKLIALQYPADVREEDVIMLAVQLESKNAIAYDAINMEDKEGVYTVAADVVAQAELEGYDSSLVFARKHAVYVNTTNYENLKKIIAQVYASDNRIGINKIVYSRNDDDGTLSGNIDLYFYSLAGTDREYEYPNIAEYLSGVDDLFGAVSTKAAQEEEEAEEGEGEEAGEEEEED